MQQEIIISMEKAADLHRALGSVLSEDAFYQLKIMFSDDQIVIVPHAKPVTVELKN